MRCDGCNMSGHGNGIHRFSDKYVLFRGCAETNYVVYCQKSIVCSLAYYWINCLNMFFKIIFQLDSCKDFNERRKIRAAIRELGSKPPDGKPKERRIGRVSLTDDYVPAKERRSAFQVNFRLVLGPAHGVFTLVLGVFTLPDTETDTEIDKKWVM